MPTYTGTADGETITGSADFDIINALDGNDILDGYDGDDLLDGGGGADTMYGGGGADRYVIDNSGDVVHEEDSSGRDEVFSSVSYALGWNLEVLVLTGTDAINGKGHRFAESIWGNSAANVLDGGKGADYLEGGSGHDTYIVSEAEDVVVERHNGGHDTVQAGSDWTLGAYIEDLTILAGGLINGTGNSKSNKIIGSQGYNILDGLGGHDRIFGKGGDDTLYGGAGNDYLSGGNGKDSFVFNAPLDPGSNVDRIVDFDVAAGEHIVLDRSVFKRLGDSSDLGPGAFRTGIAAQDPGDRIIYDEATGNIYYDADGTGDVAAILFARVDPETILTNMEFQTIA
jgi:Ca2+-binding RTX toxin-like protein